MDLCRICGGTKEDHKNLVHTFTTTGSLEKNASGISPKRGVPASLKAPQNALKGDPVLRMMMVRKGLITSDELLALEDELRSVGVIYDVSSPRSSGPDSRPGEKEYTQRSLWDSSSEP